MERKLNRTQAIATIIGGFFAVIIVGGLITQRVSDSTIANGVRTILLLIWVLSIGVIWRMTKTRTK